MTDHKDNEITPNVMIPSTSMDGAEYIIRSIRYHRNGVGGNGFFAVHFHFKDEDFNDEFLAVLEDVDDEKEQFGACYVVIPSKPEQCMRGDHFERDLRDIIKRYPRGYLFGLAKEPPYVPIEPANAVAEPKKPFNRFEHIEIVRQ
jgi:hypothetical protein